jgi:hypothetical protein
VKIVTARLVTGTGGQREFMFIVANGDVTRTMRELKGLDPGRRLSLSVRESDTYPDIEAALRSN